MSIWTKTRIPAGTPITARYVYTDERGQPLYLKERYEWHEHGQRQKAFKMRGFLRYTGGDPTRPEWDFKLDKHVRRVPYHLDKLRHAIATGIDRVFLVDGEKDVETLETEGYVATTAPHGTMGTWRPEWIAYFYGAVRVTIIADNDPDGQGLRDAWRIADSFEMLGVLFDVMQVPVGKDVTEFARTA